MVTSKKWAISYYNESVSASIKELPTKIYARYFALIERIEMCGPDLGMPHTQAMRDGLFELRVKAQEGIARVFYCVQIKHEIVILSCFVKKTEKTPRKEFPIPER